MPRFSLKSTVAFVIASPENPDHMPQLLPLGVQPRVLKTLNSQAKALFNCLALLTTNQLTISPSRSNKCFVVFLCIMHQLHTTMAGLGNVFRGHGEIWLRLRIIVHLHTVPLVISIGVNLHLQSITT